MKRSVTIIILLAFVLALSGFINTKVDDDDSINAHIKVTFLYNFTKYIEWPASYKQGSFVIGVLGNSPVFPELLKMQKTKKKETNHLLSISILPLMLLGNVICCLCLKMKVVS